MRPDGIAVLDFGGQNCHLIAGRIRDLKVYSDMLLGGAGPEELRALEGRMVLKGLILSGGPASMMALPVEIARSYLALWASRWRRERISPKRPEVLYG